MSPSINYPYLLACTPICDYISTDGSTHNTFVYLESPWLEVSERDWEQRGEDTASPACAIRGLHAKDARVFSHGERDI